MNLLLMIDNYDSFTYNLVQEFGRLGADIQVVRNDEKTVDEILAVKPQGIIISPGPCTPKEAGVSLELLAEVARRAGQGEVIPVLGVCLGHQALAEALGGRVVRAPQIVHGKKSKIYHLGRGLFAGLRQGFLAGRYHSLMVDRDSLSADWEVSAFTEQGLVMALEHKRFPFFGVQFHPESILTREGEKILQRFIEITESSKNMSTELSQAEKGERSMSGIREALNKLSVGENLAEELAAQVMKELLAGDVAPSQVGALLLGLRIKGETAEEIAGFARVLRGLSHTIPAPATTVDTCGTGGDSAGTFNISTTAAFVVAGAGVPVAKHGNRFASGRCGSADVLEQLGVALDLKPEESARNLEEVGMAFLFAPLYHPALGKVASHRRELGVRTIFNLLGPLLNPAAAPNQLLGVSSLQILPKLAKALAILGTKRAVVVTGEDGLDEVTLTAKTQAIMVEGGQLTEFTIVPEDYGFARCTLEDLRGGGPEENARITLDILRGVPGPKRDIVVLNAGTALYAAGKAGSIREGVKLAQDSIDSGRALGKLEALRSDLAQVAAL